MKSLKQVLMMMLALIVSTSSLFAQSYSAEYLNDLQQRLLYVDVANVRAAFNDFSKENGYDKATYEAKLSELEAACKKSTTGVESGDAAAVANAELILNLANEILISNPALDFDKILLSKFELGEKPARKLMAPSLGTQPSNWTNQMSASRGGFKAQIVEVSNLRGERSTREIYRPTNGSSVADLQLHWDCDRILFSMVNEKGMWNVFQANMDGSDVHQVINIPETDVEFTDGTFLPDGRIVAVSNIGYNGVPCVNGNAPVGNMVLWNPETKNLRRTTFDQDANWHPTVMNNGRLMYVRWEYTDLTHYYSRIVMHANPDGTESKALYGSGCFFPNSIFDVKPIPNSGTAFVSVISGHHGVQRSGRLMIFDPAKGRTSIDGLVQEMPFSKREVEPIVKDGLVDGVWPQFLKPNPITDKYFLVTAKLSPKSLWGIYLVDIYDNMTLLIEEEGYGFISPIPVEKRDTPPVIPDKVDLSKKDATVFIQDIYEGEGLPNVPRGTVKKLRVFAYEYAYNKSPSNNVAHGIQSGWDIKRILGEVDVEEDGSVIFKVPANTPFSMQPLDSEGRALQWMRSWTTGMPGETISCVGCHEDQNALVMPKRTTASMNTNPEMVKAFDGGVRPVTFDFDVQPILDRACIACHSGKNALLDFTSTPDLAGIDPSKLSGQELDQYNFDVTLKYTKGYLSLHPFVSRQGPEADALVMKPYEYHASTSELVKILKNGHHGVELTDDEWRSLYMWIDLNAPFNGSFDHKDFRGINQIKQRQMLADKYACGISVDWEKELEDYAAYLKSKPAIVPVKPEPQKAVRYTKVKAPNWPFTADAAKAQQAELGESEMSLKIADGVTIKFRKIPKGTFLMGDNDAGGRLAPEARVRIADDFWMGEVEVTNRQFNVVFPEHDNRFIAQFWKDHVNAGYEANRPEQSVMRVSWDEAMAFCEKVSEITGKKVTLPTEAQWEWAARAGSDGDFWYGDTAADFAKYENLADMNLQYMAVLGVNPQPMQTMLHKPAAKLWLKYFTFIPRVESVDDGNMLMTEVGSYAPNPWGLYDMHGNVAEWTSSDYVPYPYNPKYAEESEIKSIRGGHWTSRPKNATAAYRDGYYQWQKANNVGFRVIIEEE